MDRKRRRDPCDYDLDPEKHNFTKRWREIGKALQRSEVVSELTAREYYLAKRGEL